MKNQITKGEWVVRGVDKVDEEARQIWFRASGMEPGKDPYFVHDYRINFDGTGLTALTEGDADHTVTFSPDMKYFVDTWSRVDLPPVTELRRSSDRKVLMEVEKADILELVKAGWRAPEVFTAKGRDGKTDIWGVIIRPRNFDPKQEVPGHREHLCRAAGFFCPQVFQPLQSDAVAGGAGLHRRPDRRHGHLQSLQGLPRRLLEEPGRRRIPGPDPLAQGRSPRSIPITTSAASASTATPPEAKAPWVRLLFHPEFYKVGVASCGCHDNRMDKIWWNEQWMGWPLGPEYAACFKRGKRLAAPGQASADRRRDGHQRRSGFHNAGRQRPDQGQ